MREIEETREAKSKDESVGERVVEGKYLADVKQSSAPWRCVVYRYETNFDSAWITWREGEARILEILFWVNRLRANLYYVTTFTVPAPGSVILHGKFAVLPLCARTSLMGPSMTSSPLSSPAELFATSLLALDDCWCSAWLPGKRIAIVSVKILLTSLFAPRRGGEKT